MAAYAQFGYGGFPSASQLLSSGAVAQSTHVGEGASAVSAALAATANPPALSPSGGVGSGGGGGGDCHVNQPTGNVSSGALSPDALSQNSNTTGPGAPLNNASSGGVGGGAVGGGSGGSLDGGAVGGHNTPASGSSCCENGRPIMTDPVSGQTVCSCQYDSARLALSSYSRLPAASVGVYGTPYPSTDQNPYQSIGVDSSAFYSPLSNPYALKDAAAAGQEMNAWTTTGLPPTTGYYSYDPMSAYGYGASYDLAARRKNATRESTATLKTWLNEHKKNPYPTKGEKIMLAIITKMTLTQVSTWFANARRRLKKENKMTWEPKNRTDDDEDAMVSDDEKEKDELEPSKSGQGVGSSKDASKDDDDLNEEDEKSLNQPSDLRASFGYPGGGYHGGVGMGGGHLAGYHPYHPQHPAYYQHQQAMLAASYHVADNGMPPNGGAGKSESNDPKNQLSRDCGVPIPATKPKIWSLADTVACKTPPPAYMGQGQLMSQQQAMPQQAQQHQQQQQQQQQQQGAVSYSMGVSSAHQHQLAQLQQQQQPPPQHAHSMQQPQLQPHTHTQGSMMTSFSGAPYSRAHTSVYGGFLGGTTQQLHTTASNNTPYSSSSNNNNNSSNTANTGNNNNSSSNNSNITGNTHTPITPTTVNPTGQHQAHQAHQPQQQLQPTQLQSMRQSLQLQSQQPQHAVNQRAMGFPEAQPDTPPQTPPNMKVSNGLSNLLPTGSRAPTIATCRSTNLNTGSAYPMNFSTRFGDYSPRDDSSSGSSCSSGSPQLHPHDAAFKPHFKRNQISVAGFVAPV